jgi:hypothetical protein
MRWRRFAPGRLRLADQNASRQIIEGRFRAEGLAPGQRRPWMRYSAAAGISLTAGNSRISGRAWRCNDLGITGTRQR